MIKGLGWKPPLPNALRRMYQDEFSILAANPPMVDLESKCPPIYDQGNLGSCTSHASGALAHFLMKKQNMVSFMPSRLALYYWTRQMDGTVNVDAGASMQDAIAITHTRGVPHESLWWYNVAKFAVKPNLGVVADATSHRIAAPLALNNHNVNQLKTCLANGFPFIFGFTVYSSFENIDSSGVMPMPQRGEQILGGHAVMAVGYDDSTQFFKIRNSWDPAWAKNGYFLMPYKFILNGGHASDFWTSNLIA